MSPSDYVEVVRNEDFLELNIENIVHFFDDDETGHKHASSIKGVVGEELAYACIKHYFASIGGCAQLLTDKKAGRIACTTVSKPGFQLDGWLKVRLSGETTFYQLEIKSWSFHGYNSKSRRVPLFSAAIPAANEIKATNLKAYHADLNGESKRNYDSIRKVLFKMRIPKAYTGKPEIENPQPLLCVWEAVCDKDDISGKPFFSLEVKPFKVAPRLSDNADCIGGEFQTISIFSISNYLRSLIEINRNQTIRLHLPEVAARIRILQGLFGS